MNCFDIILHPTDFSRDADQALQLACSIARDQFSKLIVLHVIPSSSVPDANQIDVLNEDSATIRHCREQFQRLQALADDVPLTFRIVTGYTVEMIVDVAEQESADVIVIASHRQSQFHLQLHGSVAEGVLRLAHCPVLCLRQPAAHNKSITGQRNKKHDEQN